MYAKWFEDITKDMVKEAGGKGANLGEMFRAGFPVPPGFVVLSKAYFDFIKYNKIDEKIRSILKDLDVEDSLKLQKAAKQIQLLILSGEIPEKIKNSIIKNYEKLNEHLGRECYVAVRSSATAEDLPNASFAGQQSTFVNVIGKENVVQAVRKCWASLFTARAIYYREKEHFDHFKVGLAAVVQLMVQSERAGVMFTVDPISEDKNILVIEAAYGLGEAVVSGEVTPDTYKVDKKDLKIIDKHIEKQTWMITRIKDKNKRVDIKKDAQEKQKLDDKSIIELAKIGIKIEEYYGSPQDIEWAYSKGNLYIVQSRAITTLNRNKKEEKEISLEKVEILLRGLPASPGIGKGAVKILKSPKELDKVKKGDILVAKMTSPDYVPAMKRASAIITDEGGLTSHAAIVSRELGIPCVVGTEKATKILKENELVTVDGKMGIVYKGIVGIKEVKKEEKSIQYSEVPITGTKIYVNLAEESEINKVSKLPVDGVGLLRAEFLIAGIGEHPKLMYDEGREEEFVNKLADKLREFAQAFYPRPVVYRATDFKTNEYRHLKGGEKYEPIEANPMIGYRGAFRYITDPEVFEMELKAIKKVREEYKLKNLWLMIPFIRRVGELKQIKSIMNKVGLYRTKDFKLWIMVEVPSTVILIDKFCKEGIDGVSIGTNDLTQLTLGVDRDSSLLSEHFDERNEAIYESIKHVISVCREYGVTVSVCGQAPSQYPEFAEKLVSLGVTSMSLNPDVVIKTKHIVASAERKLILEKLRKL